MLLHLSHTCCHSSSMDALTTCWCPIYTCTIYVFFLSQISSLQTIYAVSIIFLFTTKTDCLKELQNYETFQPCKIRFFVRLFVEPSVLEYYQQGILRGIVIAEIVFLKYNYKVIMAVICICIGDISST